jgi:FkbM family methyltransferase
MKHRFKENPVEQFLKYNPLVVRHYQRLKALRHRRRGGEPELRLLPFLVDPERVALDVGANKGIYASLLAGLARRVVAFEPNPYVFGAIKGAFPDNVTPLEVALSDRAGEAEMIIPRRRGGNLFHLASSLRADLAAPDAVTVTVRTARLDELDIDDVGFIKIDVEGFEQEVLAGARETIARDKPVLLVELEERLTHRPIAAMVAEVEALGYAMMFLHHGRLLARDALDHARHHDPEKSDYVRNFLFFPVPQTRARPGSA